jgi:hypothetical protein
MKIEITVRAVNFIRAKKNFEYPFTVKLPMKYRMFWWKTELAG